MKKVRWRLIALLAAGAALASLALLLIFGSIAPPLGPPELHREFQRHQTALDDDEVLRLLQDPQRMTSSMQFVRRVATQPAAKSVIGRDIVFEFGTLHSSITLCTSLTRAELEFPDELRKLPMLGEWLLRDSSTVQQRMKALETIVRQVSSREIILEQRMVEREVVIVSGKWRMIAPVPVPYIWDDGTNSTRRAGTVEDFFRYLENATRRKFIDRLEERPTQARWEIDFRPAKLKEGEQPLDHVLLKISAWTNMSFDVVPQRVPVWFVRDGATATSEAKQ